MRVADKAGRTRAVLASRTPTMNTYRVEMALTGIFNVTVST